MCDGSVRSIKATINTWAYKTSNCLVVYMTYGTAGTGIYAYTGGSVGVFQALSSRNGGEVIIADSY